jgi:hypothetical protein
MRMRSQGRPRFKEVIMSFFTHMFKRREKDYEYELKISQYGECYLKDINSGAFCIGPIEEIIGDPLKRAGYTFSKIPMPYPPQFGINAYSWAEVISTLNQAGKREITRTKIKNILRYGIYRDATNRIIHRDSKGFILTEIGKRIDELNEGYKWHESREFLIKHMGS